MHYFQEMRVKEKIWREIWNRKIYTDIEVLLRDESIDAVYIASPNGKHFEQAKLALEFKKNVICESLLYLR